MLAFPALVAGLAAIAVGLTAYLVAAVPASERPVAVTAGDDPARRQAYDLLLAATGALSAAPGQHYHGAVTTTGGREARVDGRVTRDGTTLSTVDYAGGGHGDLLDLGADGTYARGDAAFWAAVRAPGPVGAYGTGWVRVDFDAAGFDPRTLIPPVLAADLLPRTAEDEAAPDPADLPRLGDPDTIDGVEARQVRTAGATVWISTNAPRPRIVRVEPAPAPGSPSPTGAAPALDWEPLDGASLADFRRTAAQRVAELDRALDSQVRPAIDGDIKVSACAPTSCVVATVTVSNNVNLRSPYIHPVPQVNVEVTIELTLDDKPLHTCTATVTMPANGRTTATCTTSYTIHHTSGGGTYEIGARASTSSRALTSADVHRLAAAVAGEPPAAAASPSDPPPACARPAGDDGGPGHWRTAGRAPQTGGPAYQEQVTGVRFDIRYHLGNRDFDGYRREGGAHILLEAKPPGSAWLLWGARVAPDGRLVYADDDDKSDTAVAWAARARAKLDAQLTQLRAELDQIRPYARLRVVAAEPDVVDKLRAHARAQLPPDDFARLEWRVEPPDPAFPGCPG
ncbi:hypothetical protein [Dactylosporangium sp. CA-139066]|uniref:hypothetical protein n=1 Tax=Dactylosporangium sp. CA-139066 TaxID=3239930 RepID=UPI003D8C5658